MAQPERLTSLDAGFLHAETPTMPTHVGALAIFEGDPFFDEHGRFRLEAVQQHIDSRLDTIPRFRQRPVFVPLNQGRPVWADDPDFDISRHVLHIELDPPGSRNQLWRLCEELHMELLDRRHPLWELWFVTGLEPAPGGDSRVALVEKVHHSMVDGVAAVDLATAIFDLDRTPDPDAPSTWKPSPAPGPIALLVSSLAQQITEPAELARRARASLRVPRSLLRRAAGLAEGLSTLVDRRMIAPRCSLNGPVGRRRKMYVVSRPLDEVKATGKELGGTVNAVVLAAVAGGLRELLQLRGEDVESLELRALVPVSRRSPDQHGEFGNKVAGYMVTLPVGVETPAGRFAAVVAETDRLKQHHQEEATELLMEGMELLPPALLAVLSRTITRQPFFNAIVTNIPGPQFPLYFMGAKMLETTPVVPIGAGMVMTIAVLSYWGTLTFGVHVDADAVPDGDVLAKAIERELDELKPPPELVSKS